LGIAGIIGGAFNGVMSIVEGAVNFFISAFNWLARGVNRIGSALRIDVNVQEWTQ
jgi:hypothetical protein